jgi:hypothetical protein
MARNKKQPKKIFELLQMINKLKRGLTNGMAYKID